MGVAGRVWTWHEAADTRLFYPPAMESARDGLVWIGNWGDGERTEELERFLFRPAAEVGLPLDIYGVRYPDEALATLARYGVRYHGWAPNARAPEIFARALATVHVPRRYYATILPGIPTIACSRRWRAGYRSSRRRGRMRRGCSRPAPTTWSP